MFSNKNVHPEDEENHIRLMKFFFNKNGFIFNCTLLINVTGNHIVMETRTILCSLYNIIEMLKK